MGWKTGPIASHKRSTTLSSRPCAAGAVSNQGLVQTGALRNWSCVQPRPGTMSLNHIVVLQDFELVADTFVDILPDTLLVKRLRFKQV